MKGGDRYFQQWRLEEATATSLQLKRTHRSCERTPLLQLHTFLAGLLSGSDPNKGVRTTSFSSFLFWLLSQALGRPAFTVVSLPLLLYFRVSKTPQLLELIRFDRPMSRFKCSTCGDGFANTLLLGRHRVRVHRAASNQAPMLHRIKESPSSNSIDLSLPPLSNPLSPFNYSPVRQSRQDATTRKVQSFLRDSATVLLYCTMNSRL